MAVTARSWCRVDLAGGTLDIWPLGLLHPGALTVNLAVDLPVTCRLSAPPADAPHRYRIEQSGRGELEGGLESREGAVEASELEQLLRWPETTLAGHVLDALDMPPVTVTLSSASPRGGGLGASSALAVAMIAACEAYRGDLTAEEEAGEEAEEDAALKQAAFRRAALARDIEARMMSLPTGIQDHWPGMLGGALALAHEAGGTEVRRIATDLEALGESLVVAYTGVSHFSAGQNWQVVRRRLDGEAEVAELFAGITRTAAAAATALAEGDLPRLGTLVAEEWSLRRQLAPGVSVPEVEALLSAAGDAGAWGGKACGAGGGGCVAVLCPAERRDEVAAAMVSAGGEGLDLQPTAEPLRLQRDD